MEDNSRSKDTANWALGAAGLGTLASISAAVTLPSPIGWIVAGVIAVLLLVLMGAYAWWQQRKNRRASHQFQNSLNLEASLAPREIKDPNRQADLDRLRARFMEGIQVYTSRGKDIYSVPWFVIIGESGSGKTEAIRHGNLDFPPGLNDAMQGVGGTINMDWWFTNHGVILDTAGSMVFPEVGGESGGSSQWQEFLKLLKKNRSRCPINGLLLVLSVDSLISDPAAAIAQKAGRIARQLDLIQRHLDVRFPVSVLVTKCDKLTGFREFFAPLDDPELQDQMVGWSNPDPLDTPFRPDQVDQYLAQVVQRLRKRRFGLLREPVSARGPRGRRVDEVDALYALPKSLSLIAPRLRRYLETIFVAGEFSSKPVFLRGIYFTSAMQVGADMDEAVWNALGRPASVSNAGGGAAEDLGRPFFLRHVFLEKVFRERGLVTSASNTSRMLRRRKLTLIGITSACLLALVCFGWLGKRRLEGAIKGQSDAWVAASKGWKPDDTWNPIVAPGAFDQPYHYEGESKTVRVGGGEVKLADFHKRLRTLAETDLNISGVFLPVRWTKKVSQANRQQAQKVVFERSVVWPLLANTRQKMLQERAGGLAGERSAPPELQREALKALVRLEADIASGKNSLDATSPAMVAKSYLLPYLGYLTETTNLPLTEDLAGVFARTYAAGWPPKRLTGGGTLATNRAISEGLNRFCTNTVLANTTQARQLNDLKNVSDRAAAFEALEKSWHQAAAARTGFAEDYLILLEKAKTDLDAALAAARTDQLFLDPADTLGKHLETIRKENLASGSSAVGEIKRLTGAVSTPLLEEIIARLTQFQSQLASRSPIAESAPGRLGELDANSLRFGDDLKQVRAYTFRFQVYKEGFLFPQSLRYEIEPAVGKEWAFLEEVKRKKDALLANANAYTNGYARELRLTADYLLNEGAAKISKQFVVQYASLVDRRLTEFDKTEPARVNLPLLTNFSSWTVNVRQDLAKAPEKLPDPLRQFLSTLPRSITNASASLIRKFAQGAEAELEAKAGFPILRDSSRSLDLRELREFKDAVTQLRDALSGGVFAGYPQEPLNAVKGRVQKSLKLALACLDTNQNARSYRLRVDPQTNDFAIISRYRALAVTAGGPEVIEDISKKAVQFGPFPVTQTLVLRSMPRIDSDKAKTVRQESIPDWAPFRLITDPRYRAKSNSEFTAWEVEVRVGPDDKETVKLELLFDQPLPSPNDWPSSGNW